MRHSRGTSLVLDAIGQALATVSRMPKSDEAMHLREQCLALEHTVKDWVKTPPTPEDRESLMKSVLALQVALLKVHRRMDEQSP